MAATSNTLDQIDTKLDELDVLIAKLAIPNVNQYRTQLYDLYAALEAAVEENA